MIETLADVLKAIEERKKLVQVLEDSPSHKLEKEMADVICQLGRPTTFTISNLRIEIVQK